MELVAVAVGMTEVDKLAEDKIVRDNPKLLAVAVAAKDMRHCKQVPVDKLAVQALAQIQKVRLHKEDMAELVAEVEVGSVSRLPSYFFFVSN